MDFNNVKSPTTISHDHAKEIPVAYQKRPCFLLYCACKHDSNPLAPWRTASKWYTEAAGIGSYTQRI